MQSNGQNNMKDAQDFWTTSDGKMIDKNAKEHSAGEFSPIPDGTNARATIEEIRWAQDPSCEYHYINLRWCILEPTAYADRKIFHKLHLLPDPRIEGNKAVKRADNGKRMFAAICANAGINLLSKPIPPSNDDLQDLLGKMMIVKIGVWKMKDSGSGNWVMKVSPLGSVDIQEQPQQRQTPTNNGSVPFAPRPQR